MRRLLALALCLPFFVAAGSGPVEVGRLELERAYAERKLPSPRIPVQSEVSADRPESFRILPIRVTGGDVRGLMYGLLEAAAQIRERGRLVAVAGAPAIAIRGVRMVVSPADTRAGWYSSPEYWQEFFSMLARSRFNRFSLVFSEQAGAPQDLEALASISAAAAQYAIEINLGLRAQDLAEGPSSLLTLKNLLAACPSARSIQIWTDGGRSPKYVGLLRDWLFRAVREAGRRVTLELRAADLTAELLQAAIQAGVPLRIGVRYPSGRVSQIVRPAGVEMFWQLEAASPSDGVLWNDPAHVRRTVTALSQPGFAGFEIQAPAAGETTTDALFYLLWGRLSYDPKTPDSVWSRERKAR
jgi:hypothetical protein